MHGELTEVFDFLAAHPPFAQLPKDVIESLLRHLSIRYFRRGTSFPPPSQGKALYIVRKGAIEFRGPREELVEKLGEGDLHFALCFGHDTLQHGLMVEDSLVYQLPCEHLQRLREQHAEFGSYFDHTLTSRLHRAVERMVDSPANAALLSMAAGTLATRPVIHVSPETSIRAAAQRMSQEKISSLLVCHEGNTIGILTDQDIRARCVADGLSFDEPVIRIMTSQPHWVSQDIPAFEALLMMTRLHVRHLPVASEQGIDGMLSATDLIRFQSQSALYIGEDIRQAQTVVQLAQAARQLPELHLRLMAAGTSAHQLGQAISTLTDAITRRLIGLAEQQLGTAPVSFAWIACGSQARHEQTSHSDQDNALLLSDELGADDQPYFEALARFVNDGLAACGFPYCNGDVMASNPKWRQPLRAWRGYFRDWIETPEPKALMHASIFFDMRAVAGDESLLENLRTEVLEQCRDNSIFLAFLAANALHHRPPLGFFRHFVLIRDGEHASTLDLKLGGVIPIVDLARVYALSEAVPAINTRSRLESAAAAGSLSEEGAANLLDALDYLATLRGRHQMRQIQSGQSADNFLNPTALSALERHHLKDAFAVIHAQQQALAQRFQTARFF